MQIKLQSLRLPHRRPFAFNAARNARNASILMLHPDFGSSIHSRCSLEAVTSFVCSPAAACPSVPVKNEHFGSCCWCFIPLRIDGCCSIKRGRLDASKTLQDCVVRGLALIGCLDLGVHADELLADGILAAGVEHLLLHLGRIRRPTYMQTTPQLHTKQRSKSCCARPRPPSFQTQSRTPHTDNRRRAGAPWQTPCIPPLPWRWSRQRSGPRRKTCRLRRGARAWRRRRWRCCRR